ncbi:MAG: transposase [Candidatus Paceibacterota bacterium]|jgi:putative transposase
MLRKDAFVPGEYYHIYNRGIDKRIIFKSTHDYHRFMMLFYVANSDEPIKLDNLINILHKDYQEVFSSKRGKQLVSIGAWCLMPNHFHILLKEELEGGISKFMKKLGTAYSMYFNIKYQRTGSLFGGLFKSKNVSDDRYLKHLLGYIHLNPLDLEFPEWEELIDKQNPKVWQEFLKKYAYSSFMDFAGVERCEGNILNREAFPKYFSTDKDFKDFIEGYLSFDPTTS